MTAYIEITPRDVIKYELDKPSGLLKVDRVLQTSSSPPTLYGMIPPDVLWEKRGGAQYTCRRRRR